MNGNDKVNEKVNGGAGGQNGGVLWFRTVRVVEGMVTVLSLAFLLGGPMLSLHDRMNSLDHRVQVHDVGLEGFHRARERHETAVQLLSERCTRLETRLDNLYEQVADLRQRCRANHK
jgi:hypothetical protein